mgnify:CR=1 FL=1
MGRNVTRVYYGIRRETDPGGFERAFAERPELRGCSFFERAGLSFSVVAGSGYLGVSVVELEGLYSWEELEEIPNSEKGIRAKELWEGFRQEFASRFSNDLPLPEGEVFLSANEYP